MLRNQKWKFYLCKVCIQLLKSVNIDLSNKYLLFLKFLKEGTW
jgi:hypothetical protein